MFRNKCYVSSIMSHLPTQIWALDCKICLLIKLYVVGNQLRNISQTKRLTLKKTAPIFFVIVLRTILWFFFYLAWYCHTLWFLHVCLECLIFGLFIVLFYANKFINTKLLDKLDSNLRDARISHGFWRI